MHATIALIYVLSGLALTGLWLWLSTWNVQR